MKLPSQKNRTQLHYVYMDYDQLRSQALRDGLSFPSLLTEECEQGYGNQVTVVRTLTFNTYCVGTSNQSETWATVSQKSPPK